MRRPVSDSDRKKQRNGALYAYFCEVVLPYDGDDCLIWLFPKTKGYGTMFVEGKRIYVHRELCRRIHGEPPSPAHKAAHSCGNGGLGCVTKGHLSWKTPKGNGEDSVLHGVSGRGERNVCAKLSVEDVRHIRRLKGIKHKTEIAEIYNVHPHHVDGIWAGRTWGWLE